MRPVEIPVNASGGGIGAGLHQFQGLQAKGEVQVEINVPRPPASSLHYSLLETIGIVLRHQLRRVLR